jgi:hypothetical protein
MVSGFVLAGTGLAVHALHAATSGVAAGVAWWGWGVLAVLAVLAAGALLVMQQQRLQQHWRGPEQRLCGALQRIRQGDLAFRVTLRRGDPLQPLAEECNELLEWLNHNPPPAASRTGSDLVPLKARSRAAAAVVEPARSVPVAALATAGPS